MLDLQKMKTLIAIVFISVAVSLVSGTEKLSFKDWHGFSNPFLSNTFPSLQRSAQKESKDVDQSLTTIGSHDNVVGMIRLQSARVAEMSLAAKPIAQLQCFKRTVCIVGATGTREVKEETGAKIIVGKSQPMTLATGIEHFKTMLQSMRETIENDPTTSMDEFPVIQQVLGSHKAGASTKDISLCETLFPCATHASDLDIPTHRREGRATCKAINAVCPGISIGCALCAGFLPGQCGNQCIIAGLYCGSSLIACGQQKKLDSKRKPKIFPAAPYF